MRSATNILGEILKKPSVALIDDELANLIAFEATLEELNFQLRKFTSANSALVSLAEDPTDCILIDVDMPEMDGLEFASILKADPKLNSIPIILVTGKVFSGNQTNHAYTCGVSDYLVKPISPIILRSKVQSAVEFSLSNSKNILLEGLIKDILPFSRRQAEQQKNDEILRKLEELEDIIKKFKSSRK